MKVAKSNQQRRDTMQQSGRDIGMGSLTVTLITVSLMFLLSTAPIVILHMYEVTLSIVNVSLLFKNEKKEIYITCTERSELWPKFYNWQIRRGP